MSRSQDTFNHLSAFCGFLSDSDRFCRLFFHLIATVPKQDEFRRILSARGSRSPLFLMQWLQAFSKKYHQQQWDVFPNISVNFQSIHVKPRTLTEDDKRFTMV